MTDCATGWRRFPLKGPVVAIASLTLGLLLTGCGSGKNAEIANQVATASAAADRAVDAQLAAERAAARAGARTPSNIFVDDSEPGGTDDEASMDADPASYSELEETPPPGA